MEYNYLNIRHRISFRDTTPIHWRFSSWLGIVVIFTSYLFHSFTAHGLLFMLFSFSLFFFFIYVRLMKGSAFIVFWRNSWFGKQANDPKNIVRVLYAYICRWRFVFNTQNQCRCSLRVFVDMIFFFQIKRIDENF